ncbi:MAG: glycosyltransferase [Aquisalimonadaceae bacterium]
MFKPINKSCARRILNLPEDCKVVLFGALGGSRDPRKGYDLLLDALNALADNSSNWYGVVFGERCPQHSPISGLPMQWLGHVHDDYTLAILYSAVDVMVVPSRQENLPQTATEAQSCGTPVVGFNAGGMSDAVVHGETGYLAEPFSSDDLADGIKWVLTDDARYASLCAAARRRAVRLWSPEVILPKYIDVYRQAIEFHQSKQ